MPSGTRADTRPGEPLPDLEELEAHIAGMEGKLRDSAAARKAADQARMEAERRLAASQQREAELSADIERLTQVQAILEEALSEALLTQARLAAQAAANASAARELSALRATLPPSLGGTLAAEQARAGAAAAFAELEAEGASPTTRPQSLARLHREQLLLALATNAQGVYRVRPQDSLALIAGRLLGASTRWEDLFAANRHLLNDPDRLMPGVTLVVP
ncbi:MAG: LysM peptidoglycan-binding domain-containing protein [Chromatiaceae bacterium]|nr:LysM peptidoglycan-binding domain-containing protein [Chromatiaceae bacterium]